MRFVEFISEMSQKSTTALIEWRPTAGMHVLLVTGELARKGLQRIMDAIDPEDFTYEIRVLDVAVAAWISTEMIKQQIGDLTGVDLILTPGKLIGDEVMLEKQLGIPVVRGPGCYSELPTFLEVENFEDITSDDIVQPRIAVIGPSSSARAQYSQLLARTYEIPRATRASMLRVSLADDQPLGKMIQALQQQDSLVPANLQASLVKDYVLDNNGFVLSDYPNTARDYQWIQDLSIDLDVIVWLQTNTSNRRTQQLLAALEDDSRLLRIDVVGDQRATASALITGVEKLLQQCVTPTLGMAELPK